MSTGVTCLVFVEGERAADGSPGESPTQPAILEDLKVSWGRSDTMSQPAPDSCTFSVLDPEGGEAFIGLYRTGVRVDVMAQGTVYPVPAKETFSNPGFETTAATWAVSGGAAVRSSVRPHSGGYSLAVTPSVSGPVSLWLGPGTFQPAGTNPDAWDAITTTEAGQLWSLRAALWMPLGATATVRAALYSGPYSTAGVTAGTDVLVTGQGGWTDITHELQADADGLWVGLNIVLNPVGPQWDQMPPALTWDNQDPALSWDDMGTLYVDDTNAIAPAGSSTRGVLVFSGRVTDLSASWDSSAGGVIAEVTCLGFTADLDNRLVGDEPWPVESVETRAQRILSLAGLPITIDIDSPIDETLISWRDVDSQGATGLLQELAVSVDGVLWAAVHQSIGAYLRLEDPAMREALLKLYMQLGPAPVVLRTNLASDPAATRNTISGPGVIGWTTGRWFGSAPAAGTHTLITNANDGPVGLRTYMRKTWTAVPASLGGSGDTGFQNGPTGTSGFVVTPGETYILSAYVRASVRRRMEMALQEYNGATSGPRVRGALFTAVPGVWTRIEMRYTVPAAGVTHIMPITDSTASASDGNTNWTVGATLDGTGILVERTSSALPAEPFFYGSTPDTSTRDYAWLGAVNDSRSTESTIQTRTIVIIGSDPTTGFDLSACVILRDPVTWVQDVSDVITRTSVSWKVQGVDEEGNPTTTEATERAIDATLETRYGTRNASVSTQLQAAADAQEVASKVLARATPSGWRATGIAIDDDDVTGNAEGVGLVLDLLDGTSRIGAPITIGDLPEWSPAGASAGVYLEGGSYSFIGGRWVLELVVSAAGSGLGESAQWDQLDPAWTWDQWDTALTWNDLRGVSAP